MVHHTIPRMTIPTQRVLRALLADPTAELYGIEIGQAAGLASGTLHPILARLEVLGWVQSRWEQIDASVEGRPPRRYYRMSPTGAEASRVALDRAYRPTAARPRLRPEGQQA